MAEPLLLTREEAARELRMSLSHFQRHVQGRLPCLYSGQKRLYRPEDLRRWIDEQVERAPTAAGRKRQAETRPGTASRRA